MYSDRLRCQSCGPGACLAVSLPQLAWMRPGITRWEVCALRTCVSLLPRGPVSLFFIFHFEVLLFPVGTWDVCRSTVNRSLWNLYIPPNSPTSLKFFFFHPSCTPKFYLCPSIALSEREKLPLASPSPCFNDNPTAQGTMSQNFHNKPPGSTLECPWVPYFNFYHNEFL